MLPDVDPNTKTLVIRGIIADMLCVAAKAVFLSQLVRYSIAPCQLFY